jgi:orotate phosphoribosyltransferase
MVQLLPVGAELLGGLELGGVAIATMVSYLTGTPTLFVRKQTETDVRRRVLTVKGELSF